LDASPAQTVATRSANTQAATPIIAIPVRNEEGLIGACLTAIGRQSNAPRPHVLLLLNNTTDRTAWVAREAAACLRLGLTILEHDFPPAEQTAGHARRLAMQLAANRAQPGGVLLCTDADGRVAPDWLAANLFHIRRGTDAVAGRALIDAADAAAIPAALHEADAREVAYATILDQIACLLDPDPADPWPRHTEHSGASLCVTLDAYHRCGGIPAVSLGEDRAFVAALRGIDARIRHAPEVVVTVSGRVVGRARGGMADTIRRRLTAPDPFIDDALEPALDRVRRLRVRRRLRNARVDGGWRRTSRRNSAGRCAASRLHWPCQASVRPGRRWRRPARPLRLGRSPRRRLRLRGPLRSACVMACCVRPCRERCLRLRTRPGTAAPALACWTCQTYWMCR